MSATAHANGPPPPVQYTGARAGSAIIKPGRGVGPLRIGQDLAAASNAAGAPTNTGDSVRPPSAGRWWWGEYTPYARDNPEIYIRWSQLDLLVDADKRGRAERIETYIAGQRVLTRDGPRIGQGTRSFISGLRRVYRSIDGRCGYSRCTYQLVRRSGAHEWIGLRLDDVKNDDGVPRRDSRGRPLSRVVGVVVDPSVAEPRSQAARVDDRHGPRQ